MNCVVSRVDGESYDRAGKRNYCESKCADDDSKWIQMVFYDNCIIGSSDYVFRE